MSISNLAGLPRAGKSYEGVRRIVDACRRGRRVITTITGVNDAAIAAIVGHPVNIHLATSAEMRDPDNYPALVDDGQSTRESGNLIKGGEYIVFDEGFSLFPPGRNVGDRIPTRISDFFRHHGKFTGPVGGQDIGIDIVFITHDPSDIHPQMAPLIAITEIVTNRRWLGKIGANTYVIASYLGRKIEKTTLFSTTKRKFNKAIFACYKSFSTESGGGITSTPGMSPRFRAALVVASLCTLYAGITVYRKISSSNAAMSASSKNSTYKALVGPPVNKAPPVVVPAVVPLAFPVDSPSDRSTFVSAPCASVDGQWFSCSVKGRDSYPNVTDLISAGWVPETASCGYDLVYAPSRLIIRYRNVHCLMGDSSAQITAPQSAVPTSDRGSVFADTKPLIIGQAPGNAGVNQPYNPPT